MGACQTEDEAWWLAKMSENGWLFMLQKGG